MTAVLWINLERRRDRRDWFERENIRRLPELNWCRIEAFDEPNPQLGCWKSHRLAWFTVASSYFPWEIIMEDDARLIGAPTEIQDGINYLSGTAEGEFNRGTWAYALTPITATRLIRSFPSPVLPVDHALWNHPVAKHVFKPPLAEHCEVGPSDCKRHYER